MGLSSRANPLVCLFSFDPGHSAPQKGTPVLNMCMYEHSEVFGARGMGTCRCVRARRMAGFSLWKHEQAYTKGVREDTVAFLWGCWTSGRTGRLVQTGRLDESALLKLLLLVPSKNFGVKRDVSKICSYCNGGSFCWDLLHSISAPPVFYSAGSTFVGVLI